MAAAIAADRTSGSDAPRDIRVLVVDDSSAVRRIVTQVLANSEGITVVGTANDGQEAVAAVTRLQPDVVTLDIEMPVLDGMAALREIRRIAPRLPVIMFSTLTERGGAKTLEALALGASDYVTKPSRSSDLGDAMTSVTDQLVPKVRALCRPRSVLPVAPPRAQPVVREPRGRSGSPGYGLHAAAPTTNPFVAVPVPRTPGQAPANTSRTPALDQFRRQRRGVVVIGCSTGGPEALARLLVHLPESFPIPIAVVQHMPALFTRLFAERLDRLCALTVREAAGGEVLTPGQVLIAPGGQHLKLVRGDGSPSSVMTQLTTDDAENYCRPSVDVLFRSAVSAYGSEAVCVVLTGMGHDGRDGAADVRAAGGRVLAQDEESSVVWGMPGAVVGAGTAHDVLPLGDLAGALLQLVNMTAQPRIGSRS